MHLHAVSNLQVKKEYHILDRLYTNGKIPVPQPLHFSTQSECRIVGTDFLVMEYVKVCT